MSQPNHTSSILASPKTSVISNKTAHEKRKNRKSALNKKIKTVVTVKEKLSKCRIALQLPLDTCVHFRCRDAFPPSVQRRLQDIAKSLVKPGLGVLALDESEYQMSAQLEALHLDNTISNKKKVVELFLNDKVFHLRHYLSGVLLRDGWKHSNVIDMAKKALVKAGFRADKGYTRLPGTHQEYITAGLDSLNERCAQFFAKGGAFALWRCVFRVSDFTPSRMALVENVNVLAKFAFTCQANGLVPILACDLLEEGEYSCKDAHRALKNILVHLANAMIINGVIMEGTLIRVSPTYPGVCFRGSPEECSPTTIALDTVKAIKQSMPPAIAGVMLSRGKQLCESIIVLNQMQLVPINKCYFKTFCYSRVIQESVLAAWDGSEKNFSKARNELMHKLKACSLASMGELGENNKNFLTEINATPQCLMDLLHVSPPSDKKPAASPQSIPQSTEIFKKKHAPAPQRIPQSTEIINKKHAPAPQSILRSR